MAHGTTPIRTVDEWTAGGKKQVLGLRVPQSAGARAAGVLVRWTEGEGFTAITDKIAAARHAALANDLVLVVADLRRRVEALEGEALMVLSDRVVELRARLDAVDVATMNQEFHVEPETA